MRPAKRLFTEAWCRTTSFQDRAGFVTSQPLTVETHDLAGTMHLGRCLGQLLFPGAVVALIGPLGAGKTHLVRAVAEGLAIGDSRVVNSPTFVLIQEYDARLPIYHFDAYRLSGAREFLGLGAHEYFEGVGVCLVEWADRVTDCLPAEQLRVILSVIGETRRRIEIVGQGQRYRALMDELGRRLSFESGGGAENPCQLVSS
jgi:tRNA threonylcarbamoyladenosine biosynthesis protein TsaE